MRMLQRYEASRSGNTWTSIGIGTAVALIVGLEELDRYGSKGKLNEYGMLMPDLPFLMMCF